MSSMINQIQLDSENICFGPEPEFNDETRQILTLHWDGQIGFKSYRYGDQTLLRRKTVSVSDTVMQHIFDKIEAAVLDPLYTSVLAMDVGTWKLNIDYQDYQRSFFGSLIPNDRFDKVSDDLRQITRISQLFAFNDNYGRPNGPQLLPRNE